MCIAAVVLRSRTAARSPGTRRVRSISASPDRRATQMQTVPTGLSGVPPPGPAIPVMPIPRDAPNREAAPAASAAATSADTAPYRAMSDGGTSANAALASLEYATTPPST